MLTHKHLTRIEAIGELAGYGTDQKDKKFFTEKGKNSVNFLEKDPFLFAGVSYALFSHVPTFYSLCKGTEDYNHRAEVLQNSKYNA